jgi:hypothetical protein
MHLMKNSNQNNPLISNKINMTLLIGSIVVFTISCLYFLSYYEYDMNYWDEGVPLNGALRMLRGERPIRDFLAYPPGRYIVYLLSMKIGGINVTSPRIAMSFITPIIAVFIWILSRRIGLKHSAIIPWLIFLLMPMYYYYRFFTLSLIIMALCIDIMLQPVTRKNALASGLLSVIIVWLRVELSIILLLIFLVIPVVRRDRGKPGMAIYSFLPLLIMLTGKLALVVYIGGLNSWVNYLRIVKTVSLGGFKEMGLPWPPLLSMDYLQRINIFQLFRDIMFFLPPTVLAFSALEIVKNRFKNTTLTAIFLTGFAGLGLIVWRGGYGNLIRSFPPIIILAVYLVTRKTRFYQLKIVSGLILFSGIALDSLVINPEIYQSISLKTRLTDARFNHPRCNAYMNMYDCRDVSDVLSLLESQKKFNYKTMVAFPFHPMLNFLTDYQSNSYYEWLLPGINSDSNIRDEVIKDIQNNAPDLIVVNDMPLDGIESRRFSNQFPKLMTWIYHDYFKWEDVSSFEIYLKKPENSSVLGKDADELVVYASGSNEIARALDMPGSGFSIFQTVDSAIQVTLKEDTEGVFYSVVKMDITDLLTDSPVNVEAYINQETVFRTSLNKRKSTDVLIVPLNKFTDSDGQVDLFIRCSSEQKNQRIVWLNPVLLDWNASEFIVDRYCQLQ